MVEEDCQTDEFVKQSKNQECQTNFDPELVSTEVDAQDDLM
jgi:hypothetical protein